MEGYSPKLPLTKDANDGLYALNKTALESIKQDLKMLVLTNPGERMMDPNYGVGLRRILFEQNTPEVGRIISQSINKQVSIYMNFINVYDIQVFTPEGNENAIYVKLVFTIPSFNTTEELNLALSAN